MSTAAPFASLLAKLDLSEKVSLLTGRDFWSTVAIPKIGLRSMVLSDGPSGVRGPTWDERSPSANLPSATALASSWDLDVARRYGHASAVEARRKGVDVVLGPTINLHRSPLGGRHFEAFSEDPILTGDLGAAYVSGVQEQGVAATPKHYVANDFETERFTASVSVDDRTLRELYLLAFEKTITEARAWVVMSAYNSINGVTASEHEMLTTPLNTEWGFDGVVVSDWTGVRSVAAARAAQDLAMPGPVGAWGQALIDAVARGEVTEDAIDRKVLRILQLAARVGALDGSDPAAPEPLDVEAFARQAQVEGTVMTRNNGLLPLPQSARRIAVIGHNAQAARSQGGGSATVIPEHVISPLDGIRAAFPQASVDFALGAVVQNGLRDLPTDELTNPVSGERGVRLRLLDADGTELHAEDRFATSYVWFGGDTPIAQGRIVEVRTRWTPTTGGLASFGFKGVGHGTLTLDGTVIVDADAEAKGDDLGAALLSPTVQTGTVNLDAGHAYNLTYRFVYVPGPGGLANALATGFGLGPDPADPEKLLEEAEQLARDSDVVVLLVGTNSEVESEGFDRCNLDLPGRQNELATRVLAANPRTVAVVNAGAPVLLPWIGQASAVLLTWFGGQEYGDALGDVLCGDAEPGGRMPTTWPQRFEDLPVWDVTPKDGSVAYAEGIHIGYRAWLRAGTTPLFWFGEGLGYTTFDQGAVTVDQTEHCSFIVSVPVTNTGSRRGKHVLQVYASRADSSVERPVRWLVGFTTAHVDAGETRVMAVTIPARAFAHWDNGWRYEPGTYDLLVGASADDVTAGGTVRIGPDA